MAAICETVRPGLSSIKSGISFNSPLATINRCRSASSKSAARSLWPFTRARMHRNRSASSSLLCSRLNSSTPLPVRSAMASAQLQTRAVLPMLGRAATMMSSAG